MTHIFNRRVIVTYIYIYIHVICIYIYIYIHINNIYIHIRERLGLGIEEKTLWLLVCFASPDTLYSLYIESIVHSGRYCGTLSIDLTFGKFEEILLFIMFSFCISLRDDFLYF